jgi:hypothetical protein
MHNAFRPESAIWSIPGSLFPGRDGAKIDGAQLYCKGRGKLSFMGHVLIENRSGLIVAAMLSKTAGTAERAAATMIGAARGAAPDT